jgi:hypothetical protein
MLQGLLGHFKYDRQPAVDSVDYAHGHLRSGVPVMGAHGAAPMLPSSAAGVVAHELVNDTGRDAGVLQPGRVGVAEVMGPMEVHRIQQGITRHRQRRPSPRRLVLVVDVGRSQGGGVQFVEGNRHRDRADRAAAVCAKAGGELVNALWSVVAEGLQDPSAVGRRGTAGSASLATAPW